MGRIRRGDTLRSGVARWILVLFSFRLDAVGSSSIADTGNILGTVDAARSLAGSCQSAFGVVMGRGLGPVRSRSCAGSYHPRGSKPLAGFPVARQAHLTIGPGVPVGDGNLPHGAAVLLPITGLPANDCCAVIAALPLPKSMSVPQLRSSHATGSSRGDSAVEVSTADRSSRIKTAAIA